MMERKLTFREQYNLLRWLPRAIAHARNLSGLSASPLGFSPIMAFCAFGFTAEAYHERTCILLDALAMQPTHTLSWYSTFVVKFRLRATLIDLKGRQV